LSSTASSRIASVRSRRASALFSRCRASSRRACSTKLMMATGHP